MEHFEGGTGNKNETEPIPQLNERTGLSYDYINEYAALITFHSGDGIEEVKKFIKAKNFRLMNYEEYFQALGNYKDIVTEKNKQAVERIRILVDEFNEMTKDIEHLDEERFLRIFSEIQTLIKGVNTLFGRDFFDK